MNTGFLYIPQVAALAYLQGSRDDCPFNDEQPKADLRECGPIR